MANGEKIPLKTLTEVEQETLPVFEVVRHIFCIGVQAINVDHWGSAYLYAFLDQSLAQLKERMNIILFAAPTLLPCWNN